MEKDNEGLIEAKELAKYIINTSPSDLSNLMLQKTMYFVELDYRKHNNGQRLIKDNFEPWQYGPVVPSVYEEYRSYGSRYIERTEKKQVSGDIKNVIDSSIARCSDKSAWELVEESHRSDGAWQKSKDMGLTTMDEKLITEEAEKYGE